MSQSAARATSATSAADVALSGRWLVVARAGWLALTLFILTLAAIAIPHADAVLQSVCQPGSPCLAIQLTPYDLRLLHQLGLSPRFLAAYQVGWDVGTVLIYTTLAALIFWRRSSDKMPLFCAYMLVSTSITYTSFLDDGLRPLAPFWYWPVGAIELVGLVSLLTFFLLFPSGRFAPHWTRWLVLVIVLAEVYYVFITNPLLASTTSGPPFDFLELATIVFILVALQIYRYRRVSTYEERQQTKWVVFGCSVAFIGAIVSFALLHFFPDELVQSSVFQILAINTVSACFFLLIPLSIAMAILRSRLYDIDIIINQALVYGSLTSLLGALYAGLIVGLTSLAGLFAPQAATNSVALVISTLAIFVLFLPVRRRIQSVIDRRFYRRKYDAETILHDFSATLRQEVDLEELHARLLAVVQETMHPTYISLWLSQPEWRPTSETHHI